MNTLVSRIGAVCYAIWGILHLQAAQKVYVLAATMTSGMAQGRLYQSAWNLAALAVAAIVLAVWLNWRNDKAGYWANLAIISVTDVGFILFVLGPGYIPMILGIAGPVFWILGAIFTTLAYRWPRKPQSA